MNVNELFLDQIWMKITGTGEKSLIPSSIPGMPKLDQI